MQVASIQEACGPWRNSAKELMMLAGDVAMVTAPWASQDRDRIGFSGWSESLHSVSGLGGTEPVGAPPASDPAQKEQTGNPPAAGIPGMRADWAMQALGMLLPQWSVRIQRRTGMATSLVAQISCLGGERWRGDALKTWLSTWKVLW